jgi:uncharacterized protein (DUF305 family)
MRFSTSMRAAAALLLAGCASNPRPSTGVTLAAGTGTVGAGSAATTRAVAIADSTARLFDPADVEFMQGMIPHHAQAIVMSQYAVPNGARYEVVRLAQRITISQRDEIRMMRGWLGERKQEVPDSLATRHMMKMGTMVHEVMMPGMLSDEEMAALSKARGAEFDRLYLRGMIGHHRGAIEMVNELFRHGNAGHDDTVFRFASEVIADQSAEITRMTQMLETIPPLKD